jgi:hypothetical protein
MTTIYGIQRKDIRDIQENGSKSREDRIRSKRMKNKIYDYINIRK